MKKMLLILSVLFSVSTMASPLSPVKAQDCTIAKTPSYYPTSPRSVVGTNTYNQEAESALKAILSSNKYQVSTEQDLLSDTITTYSLVKKKEATTDAEYPAAGCTRSATLSAVCLVDAGTSTVKCGDICQYNYNCIDNR